VEETILTPLPERDVCHVRNHKCIGQYFKMTTKLGGYDMDGFTLDLGS
jgi:hypothetical protein